MSALAGKRTRRGLGLLTLAGSLTVGLLTLVNPTHVSAGLEFPNKTCTGTGSDGTAEPGHTDACTINAAGVLTAGQTFTIAPTSPSGATILSCSGVALTSSTPGVVGNSCTFTILLTVMPGDVEIGTETLAIPSATAPGTSVMQTAAVCETAAGPCSPPFPMGVTGPGSCVAGTAFPGIGGCEPSTPNGTPTPPTPPSPTCIAIPSDGFLCLPPTAPPPTCIAIPSDGSLCFPPTAPQPTCIPIPSDGVLCIPPSGSPPSCLPIPGLPPPIGCSTTSSPGAPSGNGGGGNNGGNNGGGNGNGSSGQTTGAVAAAATTTPFTGGPPHPVPVAAIVLASAGFGVALGSLAGPVLRRRRRAPRTRLQVP